MKKLLFGLLVAVTFAFASCEDSDSVVESSLSKLSFTQEGNILTIEAENLMGSFTDPWIALHYHPSDDKRVLIKQYDEIKIHVTPIKGTNLWKYHAVITLSDEDVEIFKTNYLYRIATHGIYHWDVSEEDQKNLHNQFNTLTEA